MNGYRKAKRKILRLLKAITIKKDQQVKDSMRRNLNTSKYEIGEFTYGSPEVFEWGEGTTLKIGKFCSIASEVKIFLGGNHRIDWVSTYPFNIINGEFPNGKEIVGHPASKGDVIIGNDVWIGYGATILSGVKIGDGAVIAAKSVITRDVGAYEIYAGNPAKLIKKRFSDDIIKEFCKIQWWNRSVEEINSNLDVICSTNYQEVIRRFNKII